ncbi:DUF2336 domain-containing protein [Sneathiella sp.]|uniref:DUF2336 domain-containing protein n=1 Tax=Sneathiella sp. TaxID=1964365 RepID=UPI0035655FF9
MEIKHLLGLAENKQPEQREFLYKKISDFLVNDDNSFTEVEKEIMGDIICRITADVEKSIRAHFAKRLAKKLNVPKDLMVFLANEEIEVALPILQDCGLLFEPDLLEIIKHRSTQHRLAVAARDNISEDVCTALCEINNPEITLTLLENHSAQMPLLLLNYLGEQSEFIPQYQLPLLKRPFLPRPVAEKMYRWVSMSLREYIIENFEIDAKALDVDIHDREETIGAISGDCDPSALLVEKLHKSGELSSRFMIKSLHQGEIDLFEFSFAKLLDLDIQVVRKIVYAENSELLAVACRALDIDRVIFKTIYDLTTSIRDKGTSILSLTKSAPMDFYDLLGTDAAKEALRNAEFMAGEIRYAETG